MSKDEILHSLKEIVEPYVQNDINFEHFNEKTDFLKDLEINSAHLVDIVLDVEDEFDITIETNAMDQVLTVQDVIKLINAKRAVV